MTTIWYSRNNTQYNLPISLLVQAYPAAALAAFLLLGFSARAHADTLGDFQDAAAQKGCASIPYTSVRSECGNAQDRVNQWCKGGMGEISCKSIGALSGVRTNIAGIRSKLGSLESSRKGLEKQLSSTSDAAQKKTIQTDIKEIDEDIYDLEGKIAALEGQIAKDTAVINQRIEIGQGCVQARKDVQTLFLEARTKASTETDDDVEVIATQLIAYWDKERDIHAIPIRDYEGAVKLCQDRL